MLRYCWLNSGPDGARWGSTSALGLVPPQLQNGTPRTHPSAVEPLRAPGWLHRCRSWSSAQTALTASASTTKFYTKLPSQWLLHGPLRSTRVHRHVLGGRGVGGGARFDPHPVQLWASKTGCPHWACHVCSGFETEDDICWKIRRHGIADAKPCHQRSAARDSK